MTIFTEYQSPVGTLLLAATDAGICGIYFEQHRHFRGSAGWTRHSGPLDGHLAEAARQLDAYFAGTRTRFTLPLDLRGTPFQQSVWQALLEIDYGQTTSYGMHAQRIGNPKALRATGAAIGKNPVSIVVPCHRVIGATGQVTGYAGGLERKRYLLALEGATAA